MLDRSSKMINGGGRALVLHSQRMKLVSYVQPVIREPEDSWHRSAFDSWIHIIKLYRYPRTLCGITLKHRLNLLQIYKALTAKTSSKVTETLTLAPLPVREVHIKGCSRCRVGQIFIKFRLFAHEIFLQTQIYSF